LGISRGDELVTSINISPFSPSSQLEEMLNAVSTISDAGSVAVKRQGYEGSEADFWFSDVQVEFTIIFLTRLGLPEHDMVTLSLSAQQSSCVSNSTQLDVSVRIASVQSFSSPASFNAGFNISSQLQRVTRSLPLDASREMLRDELTGLLSWGCEEEEGLDGKTLLYEDYENNGRGRRRDNSTFFCGSYSERDPSQIWNPSDEAFRISDYPYVSSRMSSQQ
jgi:hypothetical protein